jgi:hypothetical protein
MPTAVSSALIDALTSWIGPSSTPPRSSQYTISKALSKQTQIGWENILRGRISNQWRGAIQTPIPSKDKKRAAKALSCTAKVIIALWDYAFTIWEARNAAIHGQTETSTTSKAIKQLQKLAKDLYVQHDRDPHLVPSSCSYLFDKPLLVTQQLPTNSLRCWISSVSEAIKTRQFRENLQHTKQRKLMQRFFLHKL